MKIKSIYISQGFFCTERFFEPGFNLIFSEKNSTGKTTLMRCILYGLGYAVPGTKKFNIEACNIKVVLEKDDGTIVTLNRNTADSIELVEGDTQLSYALPIQVKELHEKIYGTDNGDIVNNLLGAIYADQEKGWTLLNRGKAIAGVRFNIDELIGVRVEIDRASNQLRMIPFKVILNGDTLQERRELDDNDEIDFINQDREELGFHSLGNYDDFLEDNLSGSSFAESVVELFERINQYYRELEEIAAVYDDLLNQLQTEKATLTAKLLAKGIGQTETFPLPENVCVISEEEIDAIINWANHCFERLSEYGERDVLPDTFTYGDTVTIDAGETQYRFVLGDLPQNLTAGDEASIDLAIYNKAGEAIANGEVKLTVGHLNFDEDGGAADGISDEIEYSTEPVVYALKEIAESIQNLVENEKKIASVIEKTIV